MGLQGPNTKKKPAVLAAALGAVFCLCALCGCSLVTATEVQTEQEPALADGVTITSGTLTVGVNSADSPFAGKNSSGDLIGIDVDIASALAEELGMKVDVVDVSSNGKTALADGTVDVALDLAEGGDNDQLTYSTPYLDSGAALFTLTDDMVDSIEDAKLAKGKVLVVSGTSIATLVEQEVGIENLVLCDTASEAVEGLVSGEATYLIIDAVPGCFYAADYEDVAYNGFVSASSVSGICAATEVTNTDLASVINEAISTIVSDGRIGVIVSKWLGAAGDDLLPGNVDTTALPKTFFAAEKAEEKKEAEKAEEAQNTQDTEGADTEAAQDDETAADTSGDTNEN